MHGEVHGSTYEFVAVIRRGVRRMKVSIESIEANNIYKICPQQ